MLQNPVRALALSHYRASFSAECSTPKGKRLLFIAGCKDGGEGKGGRRGGLEEQKGRILEIKIL